MQLVPLKNCLSLKFITSKCTFENPVHDILLEASNDPSQSHKDSYETFNSAMKKLYINQATVQLARTELAELRQKPNESVSDFTARFCHYIKRAYPVDASDPDRLLQRMSEEFLLRLLSPFRLAVLKLADQPTVFYEILNEAEKYDMHVVPLVNLFKH